MIDFYGRGREVEKKAEYEQLLIDVAELKCQVDSIEKSIKDTNKRITMIRNQIRKEKGRGKL